MNAMKLPPSLLAVLAVGAVWWLTQRRAVAAPLYGNTPAAVGTGAVQRYSIPVSGITPAAAAPSPLQSVLQFASSLIGTSSSPTSSSSSSATRQMVNAYAQGGPSTGVYGVDQAIQRPADYVPTWTPDVQGEAAAQAYYLSNPDEFIANPPTLYNTTYSGVDSAAGWLDNQ